ncbi:MAG: FAD binding domain-containing protein [Roseovarius sp.]|nr:FAD binding domain-containing protein [Roseovarius sp.]
MGYHVPNSLSDALDIARLTGAKVIAGGTDVFPALGDTPAPAQMLDITRLPELRGISHSGATWRIGAATSWTDIQKADLPPAFDALKLAAREVGAWQIQNAGTVAGNICNASPAADGVPPLLALEAEVELCSSKGSRTLPLAQMITGVRQTALRPGELVSAILIPDMPDGAQGHFQKLGTRKYLVISIAMVSAVIWTDEAARIAGARVAVGSCSAVAQRLEGLEADLMGQNASDLRDNSAIWTTHLSALSPLSDIRGTDHYRMDAAAELCRRTVLTCLQACDE